MTPRPWLLVAAIVGFSPRAMAEDPAPGDASADGKPSAGSKRQRTEWAGVPIVGGNSDFGWGGGALVSATRPSASSQHQNEWSAELAGVAMFGPDGFDPRFQDYYLKAVFDDILGSGLRLTLRPSFNQVVGVNYYGLGNAASRGGPGLPDANGPDKVYYDYTHADASLRVLFGHDISPTVRLSAGMIWSHVWMDVPEDTLLARDAREGSDEVRSLLTGLDDYDQGAFVWTLEIDTRDEEVNPHSGILQTTTLLFAPGNAGTFTETWGRTFLAVRAYQGIFHDKVVLAGRLLVDIMAGTPPVYELSRFDDYSAAFGGEKGVRGIEAQRYYGKVKTLANFESRISLFEFDLIGRETLIFTQFVDFGRLWADFDASADLDGRELGLKYSVGGGLRLLFEDSFVVAFDVGWSPDAQPVGVYLTSGHAF